MNEAKKREAVQQLLALIVVCAYIMCLSPVYMHGCICQYTPHPLLACFNTENIEVSQYVKLSQMTQFYILTHFGVFCEGGCRGFFTHFIASIKASAVAEIAVSIFTTVILGGLITQKLLGLYLKFIQA